MAAELDDDILENIFSEAKKCEEDGHLEEALSLYKDAHQLHQSDASKLAIDRLTDLINSKLVSSFNDNLNLQPHFQSTPYNTQGDNLAMKGPTAYNLSTTTPLKSALDHIKSLDISAISQSSNMTIAVQEGEKSFDAGHYNKLIIEARSLYKSGNELEKALEKYEEAYSLHQDAKLLKRIVKIQQELKLKDFETYVEASAQERESDKEDRIDQYNNLVINAKACIESGSPEEALKLYQEAYKIDPSEKLQKKIDKLVETLAQPEEEASMDVEHYNQLIKDAKSKLKDEDYQGALLLYENAYEINPTEKLQRRIKKIRDFIENDVEEDDEDNQDEQSTPTNDLSPSHDKDWNKSILQSEVDEQCKGLIEDAKKWEKSNKISEALDAYREAQSLKPCPYFVQKISDLEKKLDINENNGDEADAELNVEHYNQLIIKGREHLNDGNMAEALKLYKEAYEINPSEKLSKRMSKIETKLAEEFADEDADVDDEVREFYDATIADAKVKEDKLLYDEAIALYEEANELIPSDGLSQKIANLEFKRDSDKDSEFRKPSSAQSLNDLSPSDKAKYNELIVKGKYAQKESKIEKALSYYKKAAQIYKNEKLGTRIQKLEKFLEEEAENENLYTDIGDGLFLTNDVHDKLYQYQREGVKWMWELYRAEHGGILGDDMGLGKTIQTIVYLQALFLMEEISTAMLCMPLSLINNWQEEFKKWAPEIRVELFHGSKAERERNVKKVIKRGGVILTTYGIIEKNVEFLVNTSFKWDYLVLDEGHKIKNPTKTSKAMRNVPCHHRLLISGTPIQNNLKELWALFDFVSRGKLLGTMTTFKMNYITPIERGREKDASKAEAKLGAKLAENLRKLIDPYFLRRTKAEIKSKNVDSVSAFSKLGKKNELCVWLQLSDVQLNLYKAFLTLDSVRDAMNSSKSPLAALTVLKKICDHPRLAIKFEALREVMDADNMSMKPEDHQKLLSTVELPTDPTDDILLRESCKLKFALELLDHLNVDGHRTLLFSTSLKILNYIQSMIADKGLKCLRIDGSINKPGERQEIIDKFNTDMQYSVLLLTTQVGGVGLNLTSANRVIIYDPNWNPATDAQAVDRSYRIGQTKPVIVYRLLTSGTIEEKIYRKQVFKDSITRQATGESFDPIRYFTNQEISQLFELGSTSNSETCAQLEQLHGADRNHSEQVRIDLTAISGMGAIGCSDHDLLFSHEEVVDNTPEERQFVEERVQQAKRNLAAETAAGPNPYPNYTAPARNNPAATAVPLSGGMRAPWEPTRGQSLWNNKENEIETVRKDVERVEIRESPYFKSPMEGKLAEVITIEDDDNVEVEKVEETDQKKKLSLSDYKKRQMKIFDYVDSPTQQPRETTPSSPVFVSPVRPRNVVKKNVVTPRKSLSNPVGQIIANHILNTPKKNTPDSDDEVQDDLESSRYDNLNKPPCLDESEEEEEEEEEEENYYDVQEEPEEAGEGSGDQGEKEEEEQSEEEEEEEEEVEVVEVVEKPGKVDDLAGLVKSFKFDSPKSSDQPANQAIEKTVEIRKGVEPKNLLTERLQTQTNESEVKTPNIHEFEKQLDDTKSHDTESKPSVRKESSSGDKENRKPDPSPTSNQGGCTCGRLQAALNKGYKVTKCKCMCSSSEEDKYNRYLERGLEHHKAGNTEKALQYYKAALQYRNDDTTVQKAYLTLKKQLKNK